MAQSHAVVGSVQQTLQQNSDEPVPLKRKKKDSGAPAGKNVVVLKSCDVTIRNDSVLMPNTIEMAQLKKKEKGQFETNVQISSKMTQQDIRELLIRLFPYLGDQSFYCASAVDNRTRLGFHGERRIWDGYLIKQKIKGNSALYIFTDEGSLRSKEDSSTHLKQSTLKRSHDQMTLTMTNRCRIDKDETTIMAQGGILAQSGMTQTIVSRTSESQTRQHAMHIADGHADTRNAISSESSLLPHADQQSILSSSVTPQLNSLSIASADSEQERYQLCQTTAGGYDLAHIHLEARKRQEQGNGTATRVQGITCNSNTEVQCAGKRGSVSSVAGTHQEDSGSDFESQSSDSAVERPSDSGIEGSDNLFADDTVQDIRPDSGSVKGGIGFYIALTEALPEEVKEGVAQFQGVADVRVEKTNPFMLAGTVPPSQLAGEVAVKVTVKNDSDVYIGFAFFTYKDEMSDIVEEIVKDRALQSRFFAKYSRELAKENLANNGKQTEAQGQLPHPDSSVETKQNQSVELLQLLDYNATKRDFRWFIEMVTSAGQDIFNCYKDRTPWPENVARAHGYVEVVPLHDVHPRLSLNKNVSSTILDWLDLDEAVHKHYLATLESPIRVDLSDDDDDDSSDYFADAETSSCGSFDDDIGWSEIFENKEPCVHDEISNEVQNIREYDDLPITVSSRASFTKNERIIGKSTNGQITSEDISFAGKQSSSGLNKEEKGEFSALLKFMRKTRVPGLPTLSCDDPGEENIISTKLNLVKPKASEIKNERATEEETTQGQTICDVMILEWTRVDLLVSLVPFELDRPANERLKDAVNAISDAKTKGVWKCLAREFRVSEMTWIDPVVNKWKLRYWNMERETLFSHLTLLMKEQHLLEREQLFAVERWLAQKLSTKTEQLLNVRLMKRERKFQGTYEVSGNPVCKSVNSYEGEPKEVALAIPFELFLDPVATQTCLESNVGVCNSKINQTDKGNQQVDENDCKTLKLCKAGRGTQVTYEAVQTSLHVNFMQLEDLTVGCRVVLQTKPLESNLRKTDEITVERLFDLSCDLRKEWKKLALVLGVRDLTNDLVDETNQKLREKCYKMLLLWKQRFGPQATYKELAVGLCHESVQREDLVKKYCQDIISSAMQ